MANKNPFKKRRIKKLLRHHCEICNESNVAVLHKHHIIPRTDPNTSHSDSNLAQVCSNCHNKIHNKQIIVIDIFPSTKLPYGRTLVYIENGVCNVPGITDKYLERSSEKINE